MNLSNCPVIALDNFYDRLVQRGCNQSRWVDLCTTESWFANAQDSTADRVLSFTYDLAGRMLSSSDPSHGYSYTYDAHDRLTSQSQTITGLAPTVLLAAGFDASGNRRLRLDMIGSTVDALSDYAYDGLNRLTSLTQQDVEGGHAVADKRVDLAYDLCEMLIDNFGLARVERVLIAHCCRPIDRRRSKRHRRIVRLRC